MKSGYFVGGLFGAIGALALATAPAVASPTSTYIFQTSAGKQPSNVGTITLTQDGANSVIIDLVLKSGYGILNTGGQHTPFAFDITGKTSNLTATFVTPQKPSAANLFSLNTGGGANTPYGWFDVGVNYNAGNGSSNAYYGDLKITVTRSTGLDTANFIPNGDGVYFSADLTNGTKTGAQAWMFASCTPIPEPETVAVFAIGLSLIGFGRIRRKTVRS